MRHLACGAVALAAGCQPGPADFLRTAPGDAAFVRLPYVQAVDTSSAFVLWRTGPRAVDSVRYRVEGEPWRRAALAPPPARPGGGDPAGAAAGGEGVPVVDGRARLGGLPPGARVEYEVFVGDTRLGPVSFRAAPVAGEGPVRVLAFGDSGWGSEAQLLLARLMEARPWDLAVHMGDIAYEHGTDDDFTMRHFHVYERMLARVPFFPSPGNHDLRTDGGRPYDEAFVWPGPREARHYAFRWGPVHFVALDTASPEAGPELRERRGGQYEWLAAELERGASDPAVRWTVVFMHDPPYSHAVGLSGHGSDIALRRALQPLFERYGVDLSLSGHDHHYERTHPLRDGEVVPPGCGPVYVVSGGGGATRFARALAPVPVSARASREHHFLDISIGSEAIGVEVVGVWGDRIDRFSVRPFAGAAGAAREGGGDAGPRCD